MSIGWRCDVPPRMGAIEIERNLSSHCVNKYRSWHSFNELNEFFPSTHHIRPGLPCQLITLTSQPTALTEQHWYQQHHWNYYNHMQAHHQAANLDTNDIQQIFSERSHHHRGQMPQQRTYFNHLKTHYCRLWVLVCCCLQWG